MPTSAEIRQSFLEYFRSQDHTVVASSSLVPGNDPTLLFTNAGMVQFKDVFVGREGRDYSRAVSSQRCVRAGGKHNDLENVGYTARHHTFFEMLGNFSFGDYFKREAIHFAWEYLTKVVGLPAAKLWVTVYAEDDEAAAIWLEEVGVDPARLTRIGDKPGRRYESDNFWAMGDTGPCGPCTEIFYDHGPDVAGGPPGTPEEDGDRYIEIWNLVFMQYNRHPDGRMEPLPKPSVDTGMGLERLAAVLQGVHSNYEIDLFQHLIAAAAEATGCRDLEHNSLKVIADHIRSCAFLITDGVLPSNEGRGYVLRRIIRRALRHGHQLGATGRFFHTLVAPLAREMGMAYPELVDQGEQIAHALKVEEEKFAETLEQGLKVLEDDLADITGTVIPGTTVFKLYDTYGFPVDLTNDIARERGLELDMAGYEAAMAAQRERARAASHFGTDYTKDLQVEGATSFSGYNRLEDAGSVTGLYREGTPVERLSTGEAGVVVLDHTPFYAESGGQVGDRGVLDGPNGRFKVEDTQRQGAAFLHLGHLESGSLAKGDKVSAVVDVQRRSATMRNHSATHLMHAALRQVLGAHVQQKGSLVDPERLRFDFAHNEPVTRQQIAEIEAIVNRQVLGNAAVDAEVMPIKAAMEKGAMALFGEKYGDEVRVLTMGDGFSIELCGGCHVARLGDIGLFKIIHEGGVAAGVRRIEAVTGEGALAYIGETEKHLARVAALVKGSSSDAADKVAQLVERSRTLEKELERLNAKLASAAGSDLASQARDVGGIKLLAARLEGVDGKALRETLDQLKNKLGSGVVVLGVPGEGKVSLIAGVTKDLTGRIKAGELIGFVAEQVGGRGGGRPDMAQAGGKDPEKLDAALASVAAWIAERATATA